MLRKFVKMFKDGLLDIPISYISVPVVDPRKLRALARMTVSSCGDSGKKTGNSAAAKRKARSRSVFARKNTMKQRTAILRKSACSARAITQKLLPVYNPADVLKAMVKANVVTTMNLACETLALKVVLRTKEASPPPHAAAVQPRLGEMDWVSFWENARNELWGKQRDRKYSLLSFCIEFVFSHVTAVSTPIPKP